MENKKTCRKCPNFKFKGLVIGSRDLFEERKKSNAFGKCMCDKEEKIIFDDSKCNIKEKNDGI